MLNFNYTLDNELKAPVGQLPSGIQTQAFGIAITHLSQRYRDTVKMLRQPVPGVGASAIMGMSPDWQVRLKREAAFLGVMPRQLASIANMVVFNHAANAVDQGRLDQNWDRWSVNALEAYRQALRAFQSEVNKAMSNNPVIGLPAPFIKLAHVAKINPPVVPNVNALGDIDPSYLAGHLEQEAIATPLVFGALAGLSLVGLAAWYFTRQPQVMMGDYGYY